MTRRVVVTGLGAVTPIGDDVVATWESMKAGRGGIGEIAEAQREHVGVRGAEHDAAGGLREHDAVGEAGIAEARVVIE